MIHKNTQRGFSVVEVLIAVAIIGILATVGTIRYREARADRQLNHAATALVSDIRNMQQLAANDQDFPVDAALDVPHHYWLQLGTPANGYQVQSDATGIIVALSTFNFTDDNVEMEILTPNGANAKMTYYAFDLDRKFNKSLVNQRYQIRLTHNVTKSVIFVNVSSRVGRVNTNTNGAAPL